MNKKHVTAKSKWASYLKRRVQIVEIYNEHSQYHREEPHLDYSKLVKHELLHCFYDPNVKGGILVERLLEQESIALITFACVEVPMQNKGVCRSLLQFAEEELKKIDCSLVGVQVNKHDNRDFWHKNGFVEEIPHQGISVLLKAV
ncbi:GNAT family N-acetyltransferase [Vibrio navarrensis]|nr:GNAT family N-acetyltransferase [Vibrio navarrensis]